MHFLKKFFNNKLCNKFSADFNSMLFWFALLFVIFTGLFFRIKLYSYAFSFALDETMLGLNILKTGYFDLFFALDISQVAPFLFMVLSKFFLDISGVANNIYTRDLVLRFLPLICSIVSVPLFSYVVHKIFKNKMMTLFSTCILSFNIAAVNYAQEFKQYSVELLVGIVLLLIFHDFNASSNKKIFLYSILISLAPWFSYSSVFILPAGLFCITYCFLKNKNFNKFKTFTFYAPISLSFLLFLVHIKFACEKNLSFMEDYWANHSPSFFTFQNFYNLFQTKVRGLITFIDINYIIPVLIIAMIFFICKNNRKTVILVLAPIFLCILASFLKKWPFDLRLILFLLPFFSIILSNFLCVFKENKLINLLFYLFIISLSIGQFRHSVATRDIHQSYAREFLQIIKNQNGKIENTFVYSVVGEYYAYLYKPLVVNRNIWHGIDMNEFDAILQKLPKNEIFWIYAPLEATNESTGSFYARKIKDFIQEKQDYKILDVVYHRKAENGYLLKFIKI